MSDENNIHTNLEEHKDTPLEEPQQMAESESPETEVLQQQQEKGESARKPSTTPKAIRLATISKLLEKHTAQMERVGRMVQPLHTQIDSIAKMIQPLQKQLKSIERQNEFVSDATS